ncbi:hypothetical protein BDV23DRAFT_19259 [Aspergillus alliaceus]|uniref:Uncharacterized protein n=1 Tax=Petromyces alliaceus TaxID=209559 RepID=A0A5N7BU42_PETAA|nr:hypothetical protein BDV23DRAFT_19259 [Aspergillus alliaceus]
MYGSSVSRGQKKTLLLTQFSSVPQCPICSSNMSAFHHSTPDARVKKREIGASNLLLGASLNMFEVTTLGQPLEVVKTTMAANRSDSFITALRRVWSRGGIAGCMLPTLTMIHEPSYR